MIVAVVAPGTPEGPVITGVSTTSSTVTATSWVAVVPLLAVARICRS